MAILGPQTVIEWFSIFIVNFACINYGIGNDKIIIF